MARKRKKTVVSRLRREIAKERETEIEYGLKEFIQGALVGFIVGFLIAQAL